LMNKLKENAYWLLRWPIEQEKGRL
jgi:hypothetical protein